MPPARTVTYRGCSSPSKSPRASPSDIDMVSPLWKTAPVTNVWPSAPTSLTPCGFTQDADSFRWTSTTTSDAQ